MTPPPPDLNALIPILAAGGATMLSWLVAWIKGRQENHARQEVIDWERNELERVARARQELDVSQKAYLDEVIERLRKEEYKSSLWQARARRVDTWAHDVRHVFLNVLQRHQVFDVSVPPVPKLEDEIEVSDDKH
jgi:hypothetical protein